MPLNIKYSFLKAASFLLVWRVGGKSGWILLQTAFHQTKEDSAKKIPCRYLALIPANRVSSIFEQ